eukprot:Hpha_TRINITY_DN26598_c0_g1::TRINITY_DN26598_c0_g1_i1::g.112946::m.112946
MATFQVDPEFRELATAPVPRYHKCPTDGRWVLTDTPTELLQGRRQPHDQRGRVKLRQRRFNKGESRWARRQAREQAAVTKLGDPDLAVRAKDFGLQVSEAADQLAAIQRERLQGTLGSGPPEKPPLPRVAIRCGDQRDITYGELLGLMQRPRRYNILSNRVDHESDFSSGLRRNSDKQQNTQPPNLAMATAGHPVKWARALGDSERSLPSQSGKAMFACTHKNATSMENTTLTADDELPPQVFTKTPPTGRLRRKDLCEIQLALNRLHGQSRDFSSPPRPRSLGLPGATRPASALF